MPLSRKQRKEALAQDIQETLEHWQKEKGLRSLSDLVDFLEEEFTEVELFVIASELGWWKP